MAPFIRPEDVSWFTGITYNPRQIINSSIRGPLSLSLSRVVVQLVSHTQVVFQLCCFEKRNFSLFVSFLRFFFFFFFTFFKLREGILKIWNSKGLSSLRESSPPWAAPLENTRSVPRRLVSFISTRARCSMKYEAGILDATLFQRQRR